MQDDLIYQNYLLSLLVQSDRHIFKSAMIFFTITFDWTIFSNPNFDMLFDRESLWNSEI